MVNILHIYRNIVSTFLPTSMKLRQGNIFTGICQSFCSQGRGCLADTPQADTSQAVIPPRQTTQADTSPGQIHPPSADTPQADDPLAATAADGMHPTGMLSCCVCRHAECLQMYVVSAPFELLLNLPETFRKLKPAYGRASHPWLRMCKQSFSGLTPKAN